MSNAPVIKVGIMSGKEIIFTLNQAYQDPAHWLFPEGKYSAILTGRKVLLSGIIGDIAVESGFRLLPSDPDAGSFTLHQVTIGIDFHWEKKEDQVFKGSLQFVVADEGITVINILSVEDYLMSVISSEMNANSSAELLLAHAVISRSWLLVQIDSSISGRPAGKHHQMAAGSEDEIIKWYDREDHDHFDVCADDHCQRYQGITRATTARVAEAVQHTRGEVLTYGGRICDARFSKCCGGMTEQFENVWEPVHHPYLRQVADHTGPPEGFELNLTGESAAAAWIMGNPPAFCNTAERDILQQVLNDYDLATHDFYRWHVSYSTEELSKLIRIRTGIDFGTILDLTPVERGTSGRIIRLKITGIKKNLTIGKELEIRKALSRSHLYSSAFVVEKTTRDVDTVFTLHGAGWGHGVGLCQIGAAVMGELGYSYKDILTHYFRGTNLERRY
jgi:SpoIID/LytB domain protein